MAIVAQDTGLGRESIYKSLSPDGNPEFAIVLKVMRAPWDSGFRPQPLPEQPTASANGLYSVCRSCGIDSANTRRETVPCTICLSREEP